MVDIAAIISLAVSLLYNKSPAEAGPVRVELGFTA